MADHPENSDPTVGYITGTSGTETFQFVSTTGLMPGRLEYVVLNQFPDHREGRTGTIDVLAQVTKIGVASRILDDTLGYDETVAILTGKFTDRPRVQLEARIIGFLDERGAVRRPRFAASPGHPVRRASNELLKRFFCHEIPHGIDVGHLIDRPGVPVLLNPNGLRRHLAIIAQTGAGKSYLAGRILECLLELGGTVVVLDPNSDYVQIRKVAEDAERSYAGARKTPFADQVDIYRIPGIQNHRFNDDVIGSSQPFTVRFADLSFDEVLDLARVDERYTRIAAAIRQALDSIRAETDTYGPRDLLERLEQMSQPQTGGEEPDASQQGSDSGDEQVADAENHRATPVRTATPDDCRRAIDYIRPLTDYRIWAQENINLHRMLEPARATIIDLAGGGHKTVEIVASKILKLIWARALRGELPHPVFVFLEEAHNLVPGRGQETRASGIINTIASEGRKFKVFLVAITQRPSKINEDTLSQCGSQVIMQITNTRDQQAIANAVEAASADLVSDLPGLNRGEAVVLGQLTRIPALISVGGRTSAEGGADIDLIEALEVARGTASVQEGVAAASARSGALPARGREAL
jgi:DNA helicase HerA-like ATPase